MEIGSVRRGNGSARVTGEKVSNKRDFSQSFNQARDRKSSEELKKMVEDIKKKGNRLAITKTYVDVRVYKRMIKEYLESVLQYMYENKKEISFWQNQYFITVEKIDGMLEGLTEALLGDEKENINVAATIDEIQGLIVDIYR